jgi:hypothetical protein
MPCILWNYVYIVIIVPYPIVITVASEGLPKQNIS